MYNYNIVRLFSRSKKKMKCSNSSLECLEQFQRGNSEQIKLTEKYITTRSEFHTHDIERSTS